MDLLHGGRGLPFLVQQPQTLLGTFPEVGMHAIQHGLADQLRGRIGAIEPDGGGVDIGHESLRMDEDRVRRSIDHAVEPLFVLAQCHLRLLALGDVGDHAKEAPRGARGIALEARALDQHHANQG